jgi:hypothetical protein
MATKIQVRRDTAANWLAANPILSVGEPALETDTNITKYGDGVTHYKDLPSSSGASMTASSGNKWQYASSAGGKSFTFKTAGHVRTDIRLTQSLRDELNSNGTLTLSVTEHPTLLDSVKYAWDNWNIDNGGQPYWFHNNSWEDSVNSYTLTGNTMVVNMNDTYNFTVGDVIQIAGWHKGTQANFDSYFSSVGPYNNNLEYTGAYWQPTTDASNTNVVTVNLTGITTNANTALNSGSGKNYIVFDEYTNNDGRRITNVTNVLGSIYNITFSGEPVNVKAAEASRTLTVNASRNIANGYVLYLSKQEYPQLIDWLNVDDGSVYFTINGDSTHYPIYYFWPRGGNNNSSSGVDYHNNWALGVDVQFSVTPQDTITLHYVEKGTFIRLDLWHDGQVYDTPVPSSYNHAYRWFSWENDLPHFKDAKGNGVQGGWIDYHVQATWPDGLSRNSDNRTFSIFFDPKGYDNGDYPPTNDTANGLNNFRYQGFPTFSGPGQPNINSYHGGAFGGVWSDLQFQTLWDFYEDGIFFHAYKDYYDNSNQQEVKVDIMWNARIFYADTPMIEPNDR